MRRDDRKPDGWPGGCIRARRMNPAPKIQRILVPHDFADAADAALAYALALADKLGARITILHAYEVPAYGYPDAFVASLEFSSEVEERASSFLQKVAAQARRPNVEIDAVLRRGSAWTEIVDAAERLPADLIVMGTHGRRGVSHLLLGSVAEKVVRCAPCPVLTVHATKTPAPHGATP